MLANFDFMNLLILLFYLYYYFGILTLLRPGERGGKNKFVIHISFSWVEISLNTEFDLLMLPLSGPKNCGGGGWLVQQLLAAEIQKYGILV